MSMRRARFAGAGRAPALMLTSLLDMFTIILIFLIVSFESESYDFRLDPDLTLPESDARSELRPAVNVSIHGNGIFLGEKQIAPFDAEALEREYRTEGQIPALVEALKEEYAQRFDIAVPGEDAQDREPIIVLQADHELKYQNLYVILRSAAAAGFFKYRLAVIKS